MAVVSVEDVLAQAEKDEVEKLKNITVQKELDLQFDLGNMLAIDPNPPRTGTLSQQNREGGLRALARDNTQLLINQLWNLPSERVQEAVVVKLPEPSTRLPREKPVPKPRAPTRWEEFAKLKGIQKKKKTNLVWDEVHKKWMRRWGYQRAKDNTKEWLIEVPQTADPNEDQFQKRMNAKKERVAKNELNRLRNIARSTKGKVPGVGLTPAEQPSKMELAKSMHVAKRSTASAGRFQDKLPKEKEPRNMGKKRKFQPLIGDFSAEKNKQLDILKIMDSKKPALNVTRAVNRQMREEDAEAAAKRRKTPKRGRGGKPQGGNKKGKGGKSHGGKGGKSHGGKFSGGKRKSK
ncbi:ribosome biogenesis regulatory protein homolog [Spea bombifrons]|uniref:ribosome biogenesis regulatory protein homolog n=1 Tax=Spea bombifrons TaxID=233779 RepID=UPI00234A297A|nr:ribosome biogenesis regulatory protein homolog [Spea bombifrons]